MGVALWEDGKPSESVAVLTSLTNAHPNMKSAHFSLATIYAHEEHFQEAAAEYTLVMRLDPNDNEALVAKVSVLNWWARLRGRS